MAPGLVLLAKTREGYGNLSRLFTLANAADRKDPRLDPRLLPEHAAGLVLLTGGRNGPLSALLETGKAVEARQLLYDYLDWFGSDSVYVELQQNFLQGDVRRNRELAALADRVGAPVVATNDVHYHVPERYRLQHALVAASHNTTIDQALRHIQPNHHLCLKSPGDMEELFSHCPEAIANTRRIAGMCEFDLSADLGYTLPDADVPQGYTPDSYLQQLCYEAATRRYGSAGSGLPALKPFSLTKREGGSVPRAGLVKVAERLREEFRLIELHNLSGFLLLYREIVQIAQQIMEERGLSQPEMPLEERPPGRGRGSSVALLVGYLIGISHVDPLQWDLTLERFISDDTSLLPDIDLDFPRQLRDELIQRVHRRFGPEYAVLAGAVSTYRLKGVIQDLGKALGLPRDELSLLSGQLQSHDAGSLAIEMEELLGFGLPVQKPFSLTKREGDSVPRAGLNAPGWRDLIELAPQLIGAPKGLGQHVGGMILSSSPIPEMVPVRAGAMEGRYIMDWNKDSVADAGFAKIDLLSLPVLDQLEEALDMIEEREGHRPDLSRIDHRDPEVYDLINRGQAKGVFLLQSPAQLKMGQRLNSRDLQDLAYQVALIRPGVGVQGSAVSQFVERYRHGAPWDYDHPLEERALKRGFGIIVWQEQVVQLVMDVAGFTAAQADELRRAFARPNNAHLIDGLWQQFREGAHRNGVPEDAARRIFAKLNGHYMFPESHSHAFAITAYQAAWLKRYHPVEFFVGLINNQPMGFYPMETLKQDARRFGVPFLNPCVNRSQVACIPEDRSVLMGLRFIKDVGPESAKLIVTERERGGRYASAGDLVRRTGLKPQAVLSLVQAGAFDGIIPNRRAALWDAGLATRPGRNGQAALPLRLESEAPAGGSARGLNPEGGSAGGLNAGGGSARGLNPEGGSARGLNPEGGSARGLNPEGGPARGLIPDMEDFTAYERMAGEYEVMGIYPQGHLMEFVRPDLAPDVLPTTAVYRLEEGQEALVAGWPIARQHPKGQEGTVFVTIEDEEGDVQLILWPTVFARRRRQLQSRIILARGVVSRWDGTTSLVVSDLQAIDPQVSMPAAHDWH